MIPTNDKWFRIGIVFLLICVAFVANGLLEAPVTFEKLARGFVSGIAIILICEGVRHLIYNSRLLLENAVKHNSMEKDNPLQITLCSAPGKKLVMRNNISRRVMLAESTGIGLQNINARYRMLQRDGVEIRRTETDFSVVIPLVEM